MRRLLAAVALLGAAMAAPSTALATTPPALAGPASPTNAATIDLSWNDIRPLPILLNATYQVSRASATCAAANPGDFQAVGPLQTDLFTYSDPRPGDGAYCYVVSADDGSGPADSNLVDVTVDTTPPVVITAPPLGIGCSQLTVSATATDSSLITMTVNGAPYTAGDPFFPSGAPYALVDTTFVATDAANNVSIPGVVSGHIWDQTRPPAPVLEVDTEPAQLKATLSWDNSAPDDGAPITNYRLRTTGPQGVVTNTVPHATNSVALQNLQPDATYQFTLDATDACNVYGSTSVRLVRLNDTTPPSLPLVAQPAFDTTVKTVTLSWLASTDNVQVDHYEILRNGVSVGATDSTVFTDTAPPQHADLAYVVRAIDTNGNATDSAAALISTPDWTPPTAPVPTIAVTGTTVTVRWSAAADNVGVVGYDVLRDDKVKGSMTAAIRAFPDLNVPPGVHTWTVRARDDAGLSAVSAPLTAKIVKRHPTAKVVSLKRVGDARGGAARYSLAGPARLLLDLRVIGTLPKAVLRVYVQSGKGRITVWRGVPGSSSPRERLHSALVRHGYVTIHLGRTFHSGRIRLVLITSGRMVVVATGKHQPSIKAG